MARTGSVESRRRKSATVQDLGGGSSSLEDSEDGADGTSARERLKARFLAELRERRRHEQTARQLQRNYDDLLRSHAEKEITIEQLRLGARMSLVVDPPVPGHAVTGTLPGPQRAVVFSMPKAGVASAVLPATSQAAILVDDGLLSFLSTIISSVFGLYEGVTQPFRVGLNPLEPYKYSPAVVSK